MFELEKSSTVRKSSIILCIIRNKVARKKSTITLRSVSFFFFNDPPTPEISPLPLHDALPFLCGGTAEPRQPTGTMLRVHHRGAEGDGRLAAAVPDPHRRDAIHGRVLGRRIRHSRTSRFGRSEEHTSELQSRLHLVCRLLLEKK